MFVLVWVFGCFFWFGGRSWGFLICFLGFLFLFNWVFFCFFVSVFNRFLGCFLVLFGFLVFFCFCFLGGIFWGGFRGFFRSFLVFLWWVFVCFCFVFVFWFCLLACFCKMYLVAP